MDYLVSLGITALLVVLAAIFSGLNISLMSLKVSDLQRAARLGDARAKRVLPLRQRAYLSLASILFANVAVVSLSTLTLEAQFNGLVAALATTILMVVFGELLPQAVFVRSALHFCSFFAPLIYGVTWLTYPLSKPLSLMLEKVVGQEKTTLHTRAELGLLIGEHKALQGSELDEDEVEIVQSALQLSEKTASDIMQPIKNVFWLSYSAVLDTVTVQKIIEKGYTRIPIFDTELKNCYGVLLMKDMVGRDFAQAPIAIKDFRLHGARAVGAKTALDTMFHSLPRMQSHLFPVKKAGKIAGIITLEDLLEEIIGHEIADETDHTFDRQ